MSDSRRGVSPAAISLDEPTSFGLLDSRDMLAMTTAFPDQCRMGLELGDAVVLPDSYRADYNGVVCLGMGGSAIGSDLLAAAFRHELKVPTATVREYALPAWINEKTLVVGITYSGDTEETLAAFNEARRRGARVIGVTSGGQMAALCSAQGIPCVLVPSGQPPRASTGYLLMALVAVVERLGLIGDQTALRQECLAILDAQAVEYGPASPASANRAKQIAELLHGKFPIIYASTPMLGPVAFRWRTQLNENAKVLALSHELPELDHNEIVGWQVGREIVSDRVVFVLTDSELSDAMKRRLDITQDILGADIEIHREMTRGAGALTRMLSIMYLGDFASLYLALLNGVDPVTIKPIEMLKKRLAEGR